MLEAKVQTANKYLVTLVTSLSSLVLCGQEIAIPATLDTLTGSLQKPESAQCLVIVIPGSGPTDRDGNSKLLPGKNDALKLLADSLAHDGIASFRYDKPGSGDRKLKKPTAIRFDDFVSDAIKVIHYFKAKRKFKKIFLLGHSQGAMVAMLAAARTTVDGLISVSGTSTTVDKTIGKQIGAQNPALGKQVDSLFAVLIQNGKIENPPPALQSLFAPQLQAFLSSWIAYDPVKAIEKLRIPLLIINGTSDLQVAAENAKKLHTANKNSELRIIPNMNHVLKIVQNTGENRRAYIDPSYTLSETLVQSIVHFVQSE